MKRNAEKERKGGKKQNRRQLCLGIHNVKMSKCSQKLLNESESFGSAMKKGSKEMFPIGDT